MSFVLGLTGGIASGKTTVSKIFKDQGITIIEADTISRKLVEPGSPALQELVSYFGKKILIPQNKKLNRKKLSSIVFSNKKELQVLNNIMDPFLKKEILRQIYEISTTIHWLVIDIPLLYEAHYQKMVNKVAVVYVPEKFQIKRLMLRDSLTKIEAIRIVKSQISIEKKKKLADIVFDNQSDILYLKQSVKNFLKKLKFQ